MPTYDYECSKCGAPHQAQHSMSADKPACPACGGELERVFLVAPAVHGGSAQSSFASCASDDGACAVNTSPCGPGGGCPFQS